MNNNFSEIKSLFDEFDFYEKHGLHKISDSIIDKIKKVAGNVDLTSDLGISVAPFMKGLTLRYACDAAECKEFFCPTNGGVFANFTDAGDYLTQQLVKNQNQSIPNLLNQYRSSVGNIPNLSAEQYQRLQKCLGRLVKIAKTMPTMPNAKLSPANSSQSSLGLTSQQNSNVQNKDQMLLDNILKLMSKHKAQNVDNDEQYKRSQDGTKELGELARKVLERSTNLEQLFPNIEKIVNKINMPNRAAVIKIVEKQILDEINLINEQCEFVTKNQGGLMNLANSNTLNNITIAKNKANSVETQLKNMITPTQSNPSGRESAPKNK